MCEVGLKKVIWELNRSVRQAGYGLERCSSCCENIVYVCKYRKDTNFLVTYPNLECLFHLILVACDISE